MSNRVPIRAAKQIAQEFNQSHVILFCYGPNDTSHVVTYGRTTENSDQAATFGNKLKKALGWPREMTTATPARVQRLKDENKRLRAHVSELEQVLKRNDL